MLRGTGGDIYFPFGVYAVHMYKKKRETHGKPFQPPPVEYVFCTE